MAIKREYFPIGYEGKIYVTPGAPETDPNLEVKELDCKLKVIQVGGVDKVALYVFKDGAWELLNTWDAILNKPDSFVAQPHDFYGDRHTGDIPLKRKEHTRDNPVHVAIRAEAVLMGQSGNVVTGATLVGI